MIHQLVPPLQLIITMTNYKSITIYFYDEYFAKKNIIKPFCLQSKIRYRPAYKAFRSDSSFNFMVFFLIFFFQFLVSILQAIGIHGSGYCGFITAIALFDGTFTGVFTGILALAVAISFAVCAAGSFLLLTKVHLKFDYSLFTIFHL